MGPWVVLERDDLTMRYKAVAFSDPDEVIRLPESIESMTVLRGGLQSIRRTDTFSGYRRFLGTGRGVKNLERITRAMFLAASDAIDRWTSRTTIVALLLFALAGSGTPGLWLWTGLLQRAVFLIAIFWTVRTVSR